MSIANTSIGRGSSSRQAGRRRRQLQGSARSPNEKSPGVEITNRELRLVRVRTLATLPQLPAIRVASLQYSNEIADASARVPEYEQ